MKLFVPGRICLFGEHTDWAGGYRRINAAIEKGYTIITGTNQGIYAEVKPHPTKLILRSTLNDGTRRETEIPMDLGALLAEAEKGGFFSYAAGVAYQVLTHYRVRGLELDNYRTDLPIKKGLSSSAATCVLVARAFNRIYDLKMTTRGEMEFAYLGEVTTPSRCGRMDQGCAYGSRPILMIFDGDRMDVVELSVKRDLHLIIVDLARSKDTREILNKLNHCYPFAETELQRHVQTYLGPISAAITREACEAIRQGDPEWVGRLMRRAQTEFDRYVAPACPSQLTAPELHRVLAYPPLQPYVWGGKGVGSQGDGCAQFVARDRECQLKAMEIIQRDLGMTCWELIIRSGPRVRKAVIPAAGFGTRLFPATKALKKEMFPIVDSQGIIKPVILAIVEEAIHAGIEEVGVVIQTKDRGMFEEFFCMPPPVENYNKLSAEARAYHGYLMEIGRRITFIPQDSQEGFGHAVYCAREWVGDEPFLLMLGDHLYASDTEVSCARQILDVYEKMGQNTVGLKITPASEVHTFGCVGGSWLEPLRLLSIAEFKEKPTADYARAHLRVDDLEEDHFLSIFGIYALHPRIFDFLEEHIHHNVREGGEFQLTSSLDRLRQEQGFVGYVVAGKRFDIGLPESYREAVLAFRTANARATGARGSP